MTQREVTDEQIDSINRVIVLLQELFKTNNINGNVAAAAMETYLDNILENGLKMGKISPQEAEFLVTSIYKGKMAMIKLILQGK
jgi:hypothetical protein